MRVNRLLVVCAMLVGQISFGQSRIGNILADSALTLTRQVVHYDPNFYAIPYPNGDVFPNRGMCTDVIIRAFRKIGVDLQQRVCEDIIKYDKIDTTAADFKRPNTSVVHRCVPILMTFFERNAYTLENSYNPNDYHPGDIVCWRLEAGELHMGIVSRLRSDDNQRYIIIHNIGSGQTIDDMLFHYPIIGHFAYENF